MKKSIVKVCLSALCVFASWEAVSATVSSAVDAGTAGKPKQKKQWTKEERQRYMLIRFGGFINDTRNQKGEIAIVNGQTAVPEDWLKEAADVFSSDVKISVKVYPGAFSFPNPTLKGNASVFVVDDPMLPMSLIAAEAKWGVVNVSCLKAPGDAFFKARVMKEITRVITILLGGADSQYPLCVMGVVTKADELDKYIDSRLPVDVIDRMKRNMQHIEVAPYEITHYLKACQDGWAPAPTNDVQKAIWDKVHEMPASPIKIKPESKKVTE